MEPEVDDRLMPIYGRIKAIRANLSAIALDLAIGEQIATDALVVHQEELDRIDAARNKNGSFVINGEILEGQAILRDQIERCYDLIHECIMLGSNGDEDHEEFSSAWRFREKIAETFSQGADELAHGVDEFIKAAKSATPTIKSLVSRYTKAYW